MSEISFFSTVYHQLEVLPTEAVLYSGLFITTIALVCLDLYQTRGGVISLRKASLWSVVWVVLALAFSGVLWVYWDSWYPVSNYSHDEATTAFLTGYVLEKSLSVDNLFVFAVIFSQYQVPQALRARALLWGVVMALVLRAIMIAVGAQLLEQFHWMLYLFAAFLIWTGVQLARESMARESMTNQEEHQQQPKAAVWLRKWLPISQRYRGNRWVYKKMGLYVATPMLLVIASIASMDVLFALDSIPAIFAVTQNPFIVLSANIFALLGLRSLYFVLEALLDKFIYLKPALALIMVFIGVKMLLVGTEFAIPTLWSLIVVVGVMILAVLASYVQKTTKPEPQL